MKKYILPAMSTTEIRPISITVTDLQTSETVSSATVTHTPPSGNALTISPTVSTPTVSFLLGPMTVTGRHYFKVQATGSGGSKPEIRYQVDVE